MGLSPGRGALLSLGNEAVPSLFSHAKTGNFQGAASSDPEYDGCSRCRLQRQSGVVYAVVAPVGSKKSREAATLSGCWNFRFGPSPSYA